MISTDYAKELAARKSVGLIEDGMVVGLGTGSTATCFIRLLGERVQRGLKLRGIASSNTSKELAQSLSITIIDFQQCSEIDVAIDGADEIAPVLALIKGGGGALLHEKIVASTCVAPLFSYKFERRNEPVRMEPAITIDPPWSAVRGRLEAYRQQRPDHGVTTLQTMKGDRE